LLRRPRTEASKKLEPKSTGPFLVIEKTRPRSFRLANTEGGQKNCLKAVHIDAHDKNKQKCNTT
jgi:hypothetical protein